MKNSDGREKKIVGMPENKKNNRESRSCNCHDFDMVFSCYDLTNFFKSANGKTSFLCCCPKWLWLVFGQQNIQILSFVFDLYVCLFVFLCLTRAFHRREKFVLVLFFRKKEISIFTTSHIEFYLAIYNLWLLLIMGFGPVGGRGGGQGGYPRGQQVGVGVSPSIRARAKVVRQHWQGKSIQICSFFRRIMGVAMASGLTQWAEWASGLSHAPSKLWRHCAMQRYQRPFLFSFFDFLFFFNQRILPIYVA